MKISEWEKLLPEFPPFETLSEKLDDFLYAISRSTLKERPQVYAALELIKKHQPEFSESLISRYFKPNLSFEKRYLILQLLGELRQPTTLDFLIEQVWKSLPPKPKVKVSCTDTSQRELEEILRSKMVNGIGYFRTDEAYSELSKLIENHESISVRIEAINTYMWNHNDTKEAANYLYQLLPSEFHPYVERPRFHRGMNARSFNLRMALWKKRWFKNGQAPINPKIISSNLEKK